MNGAESTCPICGSTATTSSAPFDQREYRVIHCDDCRHEAIRPLPTPEALRLFYAGYPVTDTGEASVRFLFEKSQEFFRDLLARYELRGMPGANPNYLEIGFGNGASLFAAAAAGFRAFGVDLDAANVARAQAQAAGFGVAVDCTEGEIGDFRRDVPLHLVKASQVIEHVLDPVKFAAEIRERQPEGGHLVIDCPNNEGAFWVVKNLLRRRYGRMNYYSAMKITEHLSGFTRRSLALLLEKSGYRILQMYDYPMRHRFIQPETLLWYPSLGAGIAALLRDRNTYSFLKCLIPLFDQAASAIAGRGMNLFVLARKQA